MKPPVAEGAGAITYSIDDTSVATVDNNGELTIKGAGTANITASKASDANYNAINNSYILTVDKANQTGFSFAQDSITTSYEEGKTIDNAATGGAGTGAISYSIDNTSVATVDNDGQVTLKSLGTATITATRAGDTNYNVISDSYLLTVNEQSGADRL